MPDSEPDHGTVALVGTVHVSKDSRRLVQDALDEYDPDVVAVELCPLRLRGHFGERRSFLDLYREGVPLLSCLFREVMAFNQQSATDASSEETDMIPAVLEATYQDRDLALIDIEDRKLFQQLDEEIFTVETLKKLLSPVTSVDEFVENLKHQWNLVRTADRIGVPLHGDGDDKARAMESLSPSEVDEMMRAMEPLFPEFVEVLVRDRDAYMAGRLDWLRRQGNDVVAVVGRGHVEGIRRHLSDPESIDAEHRERPPFVHLEGELPDRPWENTENIVEVP